MPGPNPPLVVLTARQRAILESLVRSPKSPQGQVQRARIILEAATGANNTEIGRRVSCSREKAQLWRERWLEAAPEWTAAEATGVAEEDLREWIVEVLQDDLRTGRPAQFTPEQIVQIIAVACEDPQACGRPVSHWTPRELAAEVIKRKIVAQISPRRVGRFVAEADLQPHRVRYWRIENPEDPEAFRVPAATVCGLYQQAAALWAQGTHLISTDEMSGIQALERARTTLPMHSGRVEYQEFEYRRHGTQCLIANWEVARGQVIQPSVGATRTEEDFTAHIRRTIATDPQAPWIFITDPLNTHQSESLVRLVAERCGLTEDLGIKGKSGILESKATRATFLSLPEHRLRLTA